MHRFQESPWTIRLVGAFILVEAVVIFVVEVQNHAALAIFTLVFLPALGWFLLGGSRVVWTFLVLASLSAFIPGIYSSNTHWWTYPLDVILFVLLLSPASFRYVWQREASTRVGRRPTDT